MKGKKITIIQGDAGTGKTTLFRSIAWCLYGKTFAAGRFEFHGNHSPEWSQQAYDSPGRSITTSVSLEVGDDLPEYMIERKISVPKKYAYGVQGSLTTLRVHTLSKSGKKVVLEDPVKFVRKNFPIKKFYMQFFDMRNASSVKSLDESAPLPILFCDEAFYRMPHEYYRKVMKDFIRKCRDRQLILVFDKFAYPLAAPLLPQKKIHSFWSIDHDPATGGSAIHEQEVLIISPNHPK